MITTRDADERFAHVDLQLPQGELVLVCVRGSNDAGNHVEILLREYRQNA